MSIIAEEHRNREKAKKKKAAKEAAQEEPNDEQGEENRAEAQAATETSAENPPPAELPKVDKTGTPPAPQGPKTSPSEKSKQSSTSKGPTWKTAPAVEYEENRVRLAHYGGSLVGSAAAKLLELVEPGVKLHKLVAARYKALKRAAIAAGYTEFKISSGWRKHRWKDRKHYEDFIAKEYPAGNGDKYLAFNSPHESGMAIDIKAHGLYGSEGGSKTVKTQEEQPLFKWLKEHAHKYGFTPYKVEPWHWEVRLPYDSYASGEEFTKDFAVKVTDIGAKTRQLPKGSSTAGRGGGGGKGRRCVQTGRGGGGGPPGPYNPGPPFAVAGGSGLGKKLVGAPPPKDAAQWGDPTRNMKELTLFVLHETAGWPNGAGTVKSGMKHKGPKTSKTTGNVMPAYERAVHFWGAVDGTVVQQARPEQILWHANCTNSHSCGIEVCGFGNMKGDKYCTWQKRLAMGMHCVTSNGKGDINVEPGKHVSSSVNGKCQQLSTPKQCESAWQLILWLAKNPPAVDPQYKWKHGGASGTPKINIPLAFPCMPDKDKFYWSKWHGAPTRDAASAEKWFKKHRPKGICCHARIAGHHDGLPLEYYCLGRAQGLGANAAYYAMVGALCSGEKQKGGWAVTGMPSKYVSLGKKKFKAAWFNAKTYKWVGKKKWKELAAANPSWFADPSVHTAASDIKNKQNMKAVKV